MRRPSGGRAAAEDDFDSRQQLAKREGLGDVVVGALLEAAHFVVLFAFRREDQDRNAQTVFADLFQDVEAVEFRQHQVEDDQIVRRLHAASRPAWPSPATSIV